MKRLREQFTFDGMSHIDPLLLLTSFSPSLFTDTEWQLKSVLLIMLLAGYQRLTWEQLLDTINHMMPSQLVH